MRHFLLICLLSVTSLPCAARTFKVLDTATDLPLADVEVHIAARGTLPSIGHPMEITLREWHLKSDEIGEVTISPPWADRAQVVSLVKRGYTTISSAKEYRMRRAGPAYRDVHYLVPVADMWVEYIRYLFYISAEAMETKVRLAGLPLLMSVAVNYDLAKSKAKTVPERAALRGFCRFADDMKVQATAGWPDMGTRPEFRQAGQMLIDDCDLGQ